MKKIAQKKQVVALAVVRKPLKKDREILKGNRVAALCCAVIIFALVEVAFIALASVRHKTVPDGAKTQSSLTVRQGGRQPRVFVASEPFVMSPPSRGTVTIGSSSFDVQIARSEIERRQGLSGRKELAEGSGLLFYFPTAGFPGFWMKDMNFPIDIVWIGENRTVVSVHSGVTPDTYPTVYTPSAPAQFVLEIPSGGAHKNGIRKGSSVTLPSL